MRGDLSETSAADVCREVAASGADGVLEIEGPDGRGAIVWRDGVVIAATSPTPRARLGDRLVGAGLLSDDALGEVLRRQARDPGRRRLGALLVDEGLVPYDAVRLVAQEQVLDAVFDVLRWRYGAYRLEPLHDDVIPEIPLRLPVEHLLVEVARRQQEWAELQRVIPDLAAVPSFREQASADAALEADEFAVLASIDGSRSVRELADDLGYGEFEAARIVYGLWLLGIVEVSPPEDEIGRALEEALAGSDGPHGSTEAGRETAPDDRPTLRPGPPRFADPMPTAPEPAAAAPPTPTPPGPPVVEPTATAPGADDPEDIDLEALLERMDAERPAPLHHPDDLRDTGGATTEPPPLAPDDDEASPTGTSADAGTGAGAASSASPEGADPTPPPAWVDPLPSHPVAARDDAPEAEGAGDVAGEGETGPEPAPAAPPAEDVAELLRELAQFSADEDEAGSAGPHSGSTPSRPSERDDSKRKRRGLFGR